VGAGLTGNQPIEPASRTPFERDRIDGRGNDDQKAGDEHAVRQEERRDKSPSRSHDCELPPKKTAKSEGVLGFKVRVQHLGGA
jgi:hypothetical protein